MNRELPRIATWLLHTFAAGGTQESIAGDITERYMRGRSRLWYWRQVLAAVVMATVREVRTHTFRSIRAVAIGWGLVYGMAWFATQLIVFLIGDTRGHIGILPTSWTRPWVFYLHGWVI